MASGLAIVAYDYAAAHVHIVGGETGILVKYGDSKAFVDAALSLIRTPNIISAIGRRAREYVVSIAGRSLSNISKHCSQV